MLIASRRRPCPRLSLRGVMALILLLVMSLGLNRPADAADPVAFPPVDESLVLQRGIYLQARDALNRGRSADYDALRVRAGFKLTICAGLKLTRRYSSVTYYTAVDKSTRLQLVLNSCSG